MSDMARKKIRTRETQPCESDKTYNDKYCVLLGDRFMGAYDSFWIAAEEALRRYEGQDYVIKHFGGNKPKFLM